MDEENVPNESATVTPDTKRELQNGDSHVAVLHGAPMIAKSSSQENHEQHLARIGKNPMGVEQRLARIEQSTGIKSDSPYHLSRIEFLEEYAGIQPVSINFHVRLDALEASRWFRENTITSGIAPRAIVVGPGSGAFLNKHRAGTERYWETYASLALRHVFWYPSKGRYPNIYGENDPTILTDMKNAADRACKHDKERFYSGFGVTGLQMGCIHDASQGGRTTLKEPYVFTIVKYQAGTLPPINKKAKVDDANPRYADGGIFMFQRKPRDKDKHASVFAVQLIPDSAKREAWHPDAIVRWEPMADRAESKMNVEDGTWRTQLALLFKQYDDAVLGGKAIFIGCAACHNRSVYIILLWLLYLGVPFSIARKQLLDHWMWMNANLLCHLGIEKVQSCKSRQDFLHWKEWERCGVIDQGEQMKAVAKIMFRKYIGFEQSIAFKRECDPRESLAHLA